MRRIMLAAILITGFSITTKAQQVTKIDVDKSTVIWKGSSLFGFGGHEGTVKIKEGQLRKTNDKIVGGTFIMDMTTIANTDGGYNEDLVGHLKNGDFFDVEEHPTAKLVITRVKYHDQSNTPKSDLVYIRINGILTIKGNALPIEFEAEIHPKDTQIRARMKIDRTRWDVSFGSKGVSSSMKNSLISDAIEFNISLYMNQ